MHFTASRASRVVMAETAIAIVSPTIVGVLRHQSAKIAKRSHLCVAIFDPRIKLNPEDESNLDGFLDASVLASESYNEDPDGREWEHDYRAIALGKGLVSLRTNKPSGYVVQFAPHLLHQGDVKYRGSWVTENGVIASASGIQSELDEMFSKMLCAAYEGLARREFQFILDDSARDHV